MSCLSSSNMSAEEIQCTQLKSAQLVCCMDGFMSCARRTLSTWPHGGKEILELFPVIAPQRVRQINLLRHLTCFLSTGKNCLPFPRSGKNSSSASLIAQTPCKFYVSKKLWGLQCSPKILQHQHLVKIQLATVKTVDLQTSIAGRDEAIKLTFADVKQSPACLCDTPLLQCHLQEVPLHEILYVSVYIGIMLIGFRRAHKDAL